MCSWGFSEERGGQRLRERCSGKSSAAYVRDLMTANPAAIPDTMPLNLAIEDFSSADIVAYPVCTPEESFEGCCAWIFSRKFRGRNGHA